MNRRKKIPSVTIATPHIRDLTPEYVLSVINMLSHINGRMKGHLTLLESALVSKARNYLAMAMDTDYILFIDSDVSFEKDALDKLMSHKKDIISGVYYSKRDDFAPVVYMRNKKGNTERIKDMPDKLFECDAVGAGFLLIKRKVIEAFTPDIIKELGFPFNMRQKKDGTEEGEDLAFCYRAKKLGFKIWCDPTISLGHVGNTVFVRRFYTDRQKKIANEEKMLPYNNDIDGWMSRKELNWLHNAAKNCDSIIEIGSWKGRSTHALLSGCKGMVHAVDHFKGSKGESIAHYEARFGTIYDQFIKNVGGFKNLKVHKTDSLTAAKKLKDLKVDMVFIDGEHTYNGVKADIEAWLPKAKRLICGHDYNWSDIKKAVDERFKDVHVCGSIWYVFI